MILGKDFLYFIWDIVIYIFLVVFFIEEENLKGNQINNFDVYRKLVIIIMRVIQRKY